MHSRNQWRSENFRIRRVFLVLLQIGPKLRDSKNSFRLDRARTAESQFGRVQLLSHGLRADGSRQEFLDDGIPERARTHPANSIRNGSKFGGTHAYHLLIPHEGLSLDKNVYPRGNRVRKLPQICINHGRIM